MEGRAQRVGAAHHAWALLALRYILITAGILAWLWEAETTPGVVTASLLYSLALLLDLPLLSSRNVKSVPLWAGLQIAVTIGAFIAGPGLPAALIVSAVLCGVAATGLRILIGLSMLIVTVVSIWLIDLPVSGQVAMVGLYVLAVAVGYLHESRSQEARIHRTTVEKLEEAQDRITQFAETTQDLAASNERQRMAEELHDTLGHALVATLLQMQVARKILPGKPDEAEKRLQVIENNVRETLNRVRSALRLGTERRGELPLHLALESLVKDFRAADGPQVELIVHPDMDSVSDVDKEIAEVLYRTAQESLTNAVRHGQATYIRIQLEAVGPRLYLRISDNGKGADEYSQGMGLSGMVKRVQAVGGTLRFKTALGEGFQVEVGVMRR